MAIHTQTTKASYIGNGVSTSFPGPFPVYNKNHVRVFTTGLRGATEEITSGFYIQLEADYTCTVIFFTPLPAGNRITIARLLPYEQPLNLENGGDFSADEIETNFDEVVMQIQQLAEEVDRAVKVAITDEGPPKTAEDFYADIQEFVSEAAASASDSEASAQISVAAADQACECAKTACSCANDAWEAVASITGIEEAQFTINALSIVDGKLIWSQGRAGATMRSSDYDWCSGPEHATIYYTLNQLGEVVRHLPVAPPAIGG